jgi:hypothetical protein
MSRTVLAITTASLALSLASAAVSPASATPARVPVPASLTYSAPGGLNGVAATSGRDAWAVGYAGANDASKVLMLHWNGRQWSRVTSPGVLTGSGQLWAVTAVSARDAWAVGETGSDIHPHSLILHWNGKAWSEVTSPAPVGNGSLSAVTATAKGGWAVGFVSTGPAAIQTQPLIFRLTGQKWTRVDPGFGSGSGVALDGVATTSAGITFATGLFTGMITGVIARWSGSSWNWVGSFPEQGTYHWLNDIAAGPHRTAFALGPNTGSASGATISIEWNGHAWVKAPAPPKASPQAVAFAPGGTAWSAGSLFSGVTTHALILRWNGRAWTRITAPSTPAQLNGLGFASAKSGWAVGVTRPASGNSKTYIIHWNGHSWT